MRRITKAMMGSKRSLVKTSGWVALARALSMQFQTTIMAARGDLKGPPGTD